MNKGDDSRRENRGIIPSSFIARAGGPDADTRAHEKFSPLRERYEENYVRRSQEFYGLIQDHMSSVLGGRETKGLDIGAGPGVGALLAAKAKLKTTLIGYEPSDTHLDGQALAKELENEGGPTRYIAIQGGIDKISGIEKASLDYVTILRAAHEIVGSLGGKEKFFSELGRIAKYIKPGEFLIIGEPQYSEKITEEVAKNPDAHSELIAAVQKIQEYTIGHSHVPQDYITHTDLKTMLEGMGFFLKLFKALPHKSILEDLKKEGFSLDSSPNIFYVATFTKNLA